MTKYWKYIMILLVFILLGSLVDTQAVDFVQDTTDSQQKKEKYENNRQDNPDEPKRERHRNGTTTQPSDGTAEQKGVKQVHGARPDMSKSRGARPPQVVRPSGSGVPKGMGRPGGAGGPGRR